MRVVIVGASVAGIRTAQSLRRKGCASEIVVIGAECRAPYDKPQLSKEMLLPAGTATPTPLVPRADFDALHLELKLGSAALRVDVARRTVSTLHDEHPFDHLVIATGSEPRTLPGAGRLAGVHTLRTDTDALALRAALTTARHAVVVGAGFIGSEFASAARAQGVDVTMVEATGVPLAHVLGIEAGSALSDIHRVNGVRVLCDTTVAALEGSGRVTAVALDDGRVLPADLVLIAIGARPVTDWLVGSGLPIGDGIECDAELRVRGQVGIFGAGDVARFPHPLYPTPVRIEHWTNANEHAEVVAAGIVGAPTPPHRVPYIWSDQYGHRIQIAGRPAQGHCVQLSGSVEERSLVAVFADDDEVVVGALVLDDPRTLMKFRKAVGNRDSVATPGLIRN